MRKILRDRRGFTTLELLVVCTIGAMSAGLISQALVQMTQRVSAEVTSLHASSAARTASFWLGRDLQMAQSTNLADGAPPSSSLTMSWTNYFGSSSQAHSAAYAVVGSDLRRTYDGTQTTVARGVESVQFQRAGEQVWAVVRSGGQDYTAAVTMRTGS